MQNGIKIKAKNMVTEIVRKLAPSKSKQQMIDQRQQEKELDRRIKDMSRQADKEARENKASVRFDDNLDDGENMAKRKVQSDGESDAGGSKRSRSERSVGESSL